MARVSTFDIKCFLYEDVKTWGRFMPQDVTECDGVTFVRIGTASRSLITIALENNTLAPEEYRKGFSLTQSCGFKELKHKRNEAHSIVEQTSTCSLFAESSVKKKPKRKRDCIGASTPEIISIDIDEHSSIRVLFTKKGHDALWVEYDVGTLYKVMKTIREGGFEPRTRDTSGVEGIWILPDGRYRASWKDTHDVYHTKICADKDSAIVVRATRMVEAEACDANVGECGNDGYAAVVEADADEALETDESFGTSTEYESVTDSAMHDGDMDALVNM
jgi:hypothetical protein